MNAGVLKTNVSAATNDLITRWYFPGTPLTNPLGFFQGYVPSAWVGSTSSTSISGVDLYAKAFKVSCRVCHNSREGTGSGYQFDSLLNFPLANAGYQAGGDLVMPHSQRTWGIFWGSRCAVKLGASVPDMPTILQDAGGTLYR